MKKRIVLFFFIKSLIGCQTLQPAENFDPDFGDIEGNMYESKKGKFVCFVPVDARYADMDDGNYKVSFQQKDFGLFKIQAIKANQDFQKNIVEIGKERALTSFIETNLMTRLTKNRNDIKIVYSEYAKDFREGAYFFLLHIPENSEKTQEKTPYTTYGMISFVSGEFIYILTRDIDSYLGIGSIKEKNEYVQAAQKKLIDFHSRILILGDVGATGLDLDVFDPESEEDPSEEEELGGSGGAGIGGEIDLGGILRLIQKKFNVSRGKFDLKPGRFKFNTKQFNSNKFKMSGRTNIRSSRFKMKSSFKTRGFKR